MKLAFESAAGFFNQETECLLSSEINPEAQLVYQYRVGGQLTIAVAILFILGSWVCEASAV